VPRNAAVLIAVQSTLFHCRIRTIRNYAKMRER